MRYSGFNTSFLLTLLLVVLSFSQATYAQSPSPIPQNQSPPKIGDGLDIEPQAQLATGWQISLVPEKPVYKSGEPIALALTLTNLTDERKAVKRIQPKPFYQQMKVIGPDGKRVPWRAELRTKLERNLNESINRQKRTAEEDSMQLNDVVVGKSQRAYLSAAFSWKYTVQISDYFNIENPGTYLVTAWVDVRVSESGELGSVESDGLGSIVSEPCQVVVVAR